MAEILLNTGNVCLVDDADYHWISQRKWYEDSSGYAMVDLLGGRKTKGNIAMHRLILLAPLSSTVDHKNHNKLDNRRTNLRLATRSQQCWNRKMTTGASKYKGVYMRSDRLKWVAQIKGKYLGSFWTEEEAAQAYNDKAIEIFGEFACLNIIKI